MRSHERTIPTLALAALLLVPGMASSGPLADDLRLVGRVTNAQTGAPVQSAQVFVPETMTGALSDGDGRYAFAVPRSQGRAQVHVVVEAIGFTTERATVDLGGSVDADSLTMDFLLEPQAILLEGIVVIDAAGPTPRVVPGPAIARPPAGSWSGDAQHSHGARRVRSGNREQYAHIEENDFQAVEDHPLSTFSIDVDRASYSNVRRFLLRERRLPPVDAVQIEEMINYFSYEYALPGDDAPVAVTTELGAAPWNRDHRLLRVVLASRPVLASEMPPSNLVFLLDVSGSMASPDKLPLVQASMRLLVDQLRPADRVAIVVYAGAAGLVLESTPGSRKDLILEAIDRLHAGGSTAGGEGLRLAYAVARHGHLPGGTNRVILATDGDFNVGESSDAAMIRLISEKREEGAFLTVLGFGTGNLQSEKMQSLAQHGNGNYAYIDSMDEARKVLVGEMGGTLLTVAKDVKIQIEFNPTQVRAYRLLGYENRLLAAEDFNDDAKDAGELGAGHTVTALYEIVPVGGASGVAVGGVDPLRYQAAGRSLPSTGEDELAFVKVRYKDPGSVESRLLEHPVRSHRQRPSGDFRFAAAVAGFGMLLRESEHRGTITVDEVLELARAGLDDDRDGHRQGFVGLVRAYQALTEGHTVERRR